MQNQNLLELETQDSNHKSPGFSPTPSPEIAKKSVVRSSKYFEKNEKIYSDAKNLLLNVSDEDGEKLLNYMKENNREYDEIIKKFTTKK